MNERGQNGNMNREYGRKRYIITITISDARSDQRDCYAETHKIKRVLYYLLHVKVSGAYHKIDVKVHHEECDKTAYADNKRNVYHGVLLCPIFIHWNPDINPIAKMISMAPMIVPCLKFFLKESQKSCSRNAFLS